LELLGLKERGVTDGALRMPAVNQGSEQALGALDWGKKTRPGILLGRGLHLASDQGLSGKRVGVEKKWKATSSSECRGISSKEKTENSGIKRPSYPVAKAMCLYQGGGRERLL